MNVADFPQDSRIVVRIGSASLFADECDDCHRPAAILTETLTDLGRGAEREGGIYCHGHGLAALDLFAARDYDEIAVTIPASVATATLAA